MSDKRLLTCQNCGGEFVARSKHAMYCVDCRPIMQRKRADKKRAEAKKTVKPLCETQSINAVLCELDTYNRKHGTHLTYGQYETLKRVGKV